MKLRNFLLALKDQLPLKKLITNFLKGELYDRFHQRFSKKSHIRRDNGQLKIMFNTRESAIKAANSMKTKTGKDFSPYKCVWCDGYHIGKNK